MKRGRAHRGEREEGGERAAHERGAMRDKEGKGDCCSGCAGARLCQRRSAASASAVGGGWGPSRSMRRSAGRDGNTACPTSGGGNPSRSRHTPGAVALWEGGRAGIRGDGAKRGLSPGLCPRPVPALFGGLWLDRHRSPQFKATAKCRMHRSIAAWAIRRPVPPAVEEAPQHRRPHCGKVCRSVNSLGKRNR